jgi:hypothetical protein
VKGRGAEVTVVSPERDVLPFVITSVSDLRLKLKTPEWRQGQEPEDVGINIDVANVTATRWTQETFGDP